ncbi:alpha/beta hydrolase [Actinoplanes sp. SE50]|uniref:alpha/beta fold hydrolase n=1 Tax=unclassified Actinoplanes TaxID=2626549 RepID=UPI00023ED3B7|nr:MULTISPECIES: alpha/beta hydrolase [unclassified Actinoplanes]AEV82778.1 alpha/beta hydrolase fold protein [Actinoplanes sp. SE50/110]ATO81174.1 alpha/beta hydrolase [Actinoplanes sp. SE50]SLL98581.1 alpha/beta hydrolase [Actinoplanes sp. SE50/110]
MDTFIAPDGLRLALHRAGSGDPLVCLPGGPMQASTYLGDLGGLSAHRLLLIPDLRGTGDSPPPDDPDTYRCDRQVPDIEALRQRVRLERFDLLGHSAGASLALLYAVAHPDRVRRLILVNPSPRAVSLEISDLDRRRVAEERRAEPWFPEAFAALERIQTGQATAADGRALAPFIYGRWDAGTQAYSAREADQKNRVAAAAYNAEGAFDPAAVRAGLAALQASVLLISGEMDLQLPPKSAAEYAGLFPHAELAMVPGGGHFAWLDDPDWFTQKVAGFLRGA